MAVRLGQALMQCNILFAPHNPVPLAGRSLQKGDAPRMLFKRGETCLAGD